MRNSRDVFSCCINFERGNRNAYGTLLLVCGANTISLLLLYYCPYWWTKYPWLTFIICVLYFLSIAMAGFYENGSLFTDSMKRLEDKKNYFESPNLFNGHYGYAPISHSDYVEVINTNINDEYRSRFEYFRFKAFVWNRATEFPDMNEVCLREIRLIDIALRQEKYSFKDVSYSYGWGELLKDMCKSLLRDGYIINAVYNKWGDAKWKRADVKTMPSRLRVLRYEVAPFLWLAQCFVAITAPIVPMFCSLE